MIERYTNPEMGRIWTLQHEFEVMLEVEITACEAMAELGQIPVEAAKNIREKAQFNLERVKEIEKVTNHDIIAFLTIIFGIIFNIKFKTRETPFSVVFGYFRSFFPCALRVISIKFLIFASFFIFNRIIYKVWKKKISL